MMQSDRVKKWTPGPWDRSKYHFPNRDIVSRTGPQDNDSRPGNRYVCMVYGRGAGQQKANAHLIAAAPDLVEALETIVRRLSVDIEDGGRPDQWSMQALVDKAEAALSKAYGEH